MTLRVLSVTTEMPYLPDWQVGISGWKIGGEKIKLMFI